MSELNELLQALAQMKEEKLLLQKKVETLEAEVQKANEINEKKNTLIARISHEIRTPLNVVIGMSSVAMDDLDNKKLVRDHLAEIDNSSRILLGIVDNIQDVSSLASGNLKMNVHKFDLKEQITGIGVYFYEHAKYKDVHFGIHIKGVSEEYLIGDEKRLQQVLTNLFENALHFTPAGGKIELTVIQGSTSRNRVHMRFILKDTGRTFPKVDEHSYIDTGIGLYITKQLVTALGGTLEIESPMGEGNTLVVDLPFEKTAQQEMNFAEIKNHKILLVADEKTCIERGEMLNDMGITYGMTDNEYDALDILGEAENENEPYNVCMVDMNMKNCFPEMLIHEIKELFGEKPIIIATTPNKKEAEMKNIEADYFIDNAVFRSTIFDALMVLEKGKLYKEDYKDDISKKYDFSGKRILVVEDIALNMEVVVKMLSRVKASVVCAGNGKEALQTFLQKPAGFFDCILMDVNMPVMDGYEATRQIRSSVKADALVIPIFAMTANAFSEDVAEALRSGMNGHIAKPIDLKILYNTLYKTFHGYEDYEISDRLYKKARSLEKQNRELKYKEEHDPLTGLYNRYAYEKETYAMLRKKEPIGFLLIDVDYFKELNDQYGRETGDRILIKVANAIKASVRATDFVVRFDRDVFAVLITNYGEDSKVLYHKFEQVNEILNQTADNLPAVTLSVGAVFSDIGYTTELFGNAEKALEQAKKNDGKGCVIFDGSIEK